MGWAGKKGTQGESREGRGVVPPQNVEDFRLLSMKWLPNAMHISYMNNIAFSASVV